MHCLGDLRARSFDQVSRRPAWCQRHHSEQVASASAHGLSSGRGGWRGCSAVCPLGGGRRAVRSVCDDRSARRRRPPPGGEPGRSDCGRGQGSGSGVVIFPDASLRIVVATRPVGFRRGHDALAATASGEPGLDIYSGVIVIFRSKRGDRLKALAWDGSGLVLTYKRLEQGGFTWPRIEDGVMRLSKAQFEALFEGLDWRRVRARTVARPLAAE